MKKEIIVDYPQQVGYFSARIKLTLERSNVKIVRQTCHNDMSIDRDHVSIPTELLDEVIKALQDLKRLTILG